MSGVEVIITPAGLRAYREHWKLSLSRLSGDLGIDVSTLHRWETGAAEPSMPVVLALALMQLRGRYKHKRNQDRIYARKAAAWAAAHPTARFGTRRTV